MTSQGFTLEDTTIYSKTKLFKAVLKYDTEKNNLKYLNLKFSPFLKNCFFFKQKRELERIETFFLSNPVLYWVSKK